MATTSTLRTRILCRPEGRFQEFPRLTRLVAVAMIAENVAPGSEAAKVWRALADEEAAQVGGLLARNMETEAWYLVRYRKALAWREVPV